MPLLKLAEMTWEELRDLDMTRGVAILPTGAIEAHGPHLPLETDVIIAEAMARSGGEALVASGYSAIVLPTMCYTTAPFAAAFPGTLSLAPEVVTSTIVQLVEGAVRSGMCTVAIANAHFDPAHVVAIRAAIEVIREGGQGVVVFPDLTRRRLAERLTEEFQSGACHAGRYEGSIVLAERADLVREEIRTRLAPNPPSLADAIREGKQTFEEAGGPRAYFGFPAEASAEEGRRTIEILGWILAEAVMETVRE